MERGGADEISLYMMARNTLRTPVTFVLGGVTRKI